MPKKGTSVYAEVSKEELAELNQQRGILHRAQWVLLAVREKLARDRKDGE